MIGKLINAKIPVITVKIPILAKYECMNPDCQSYYETQQAQQGPCKMCGHLYVMWLNYEEFMAQFSNRPPY